MAIYFRGGRRTTVRCVPLFAFKRRWGILMKPLPCVEVPWNGTQPRKKLGGAWFDVIIRKGIMVRPSNMPWTLRKASGDKVDLRVGVVDTIPKRCCGDVLGVKTGEPLCRRDEENDIHLPREPVFSLEAFNWI
jgi:hypothetical protein